MTPAPIPVARPRLPTAEHITPYLREIDANGWYANFGPLTHRLQARLASHWGMSKPEVTLVASGTVGITLALLAAEAPPGSRCLMPSWTFAAAGPRGGGGRDRLVARGGHDPPPEAGGG